MFPRVRSLFSPYVINIHCINRRVKWGQRQKTEGLRPAGQGPGPNNGLYASTVLRPGAIILLKMARTNLIRTAIILFTGALIMNMASQDSFSGTRKPAVAGMFYSADARELAGMIDGFLKQPKALKKDEELAALIVPHAGYVYSGQVAAYAYKQLEGRDFGKVILIGASHHKGFEGVATVAYDSFNTPLGKVSVDTGAIKELKALDRNIVTDNGAHDPEHSLEVQLPFLQRTLKSFKIVPLLFGNITPQTSVKLADDIFRIADEKTIVIASTDLSHYYNNYTADRLDKEGLDAIKDNDIDRFFKCVATGKTEACGSPAVVTAMLYASHKGAGDIEILKHANSGDVTGDNSKVVGYASVAFFRAVTGLNDAEKRTLLKLARVTLENHYLGTNRAVEADTPALLRKSGAFVTLNKNGQLRGCIGYIQPVEQLNKAVERMAMAAALEDTRFMPVTKEELPKLHIEISVLSPMKRIKDISEIKVGRDGLYLVARGRSGVFLPQVPGEFGWDRDEYLRQICGKAGVPDDAWKDKDAQLFTFTAQVFGE